MRSARRRLLALESSSDQSASTAQAAADRDRALHMMTCAELALAQVALRGVNGQASWSEHDQNEWGWCAPVMQAKLEIDEADDATAYSLASALMTRGRLRWVGRLRDVKFGPFRAWEGQSALPTLTDEAWAATKVLAAEIRKGIVDDDTIFVRPA